ncbi:MAG TPA: hypothetical protein VGZ26_00455 [Pirellulales bacterium]|nr:hypothetical protein [Pirellulales bacterium]
MPFAVRISCLILALVGAVGCKVIERQPKGKSLLSSVGTSEDSVTLEIFTAPTPLAAPQLAALWNEADEQPLSADLRQRLAQNGLRAGIVGPHVPDALAELLKITDQRISTEERSLVPLDTEPGITLRVMQPRPGKRHDLNVSEMFDQISLLRSSEGQVAGKTYYKAVGCLTLRVFPEPDTRVRLELTPELHHGEVKNHISGGNGVLMWKADRQREIFSDLKLTATLGPGQMFLITCQCDKPGSIGHYLFTQTGEDKPMQRLCVIRLAQAGADRSFWDGPKAVEDISSDDGE